MLYNHKGLPCSSNSKESACNIGDPGLIPGSKRSPGEGNGSPLVFFFFFFYHLFIGWRLITLQYCSGFCHTLTWISHGFTCIPHPDPLPPTSLSTRSLWVFLVHQAQALLSCIQPGLVICVTLDNIHVLMPFSRNIPHSPSPTESKSLFCTSVSLFLFCI